MAAVQDSTRRGRGEVRDGVAGTVRRQSDGTAPRHQLALTTRIQFIAINIIYFQPQIKYNAQPKPNPKTTPSTTTHGLPKILTCLSSFCDGKYRVELLNLGLGYEVPLFCLKH